MNALLAGLLLLDWIDTILIIASIAVFIWLTSQPKAK